MMADHAARPATHLADWRFLLPSMPPAGFQHLLLAGGPSELPGIVLDLGIAQQVSTSASAGDEFDAVVVLADASSRGMELAAYMAPDSVLYWEVDRRHRGLRSLTPHRACERLQQTGLTPGAAYWVKPWFPDRQMYLPLDAACAFQWYLDTLCRARTRPRRILKFAVRAFLTPHLSIEPYAPCYAITASRGTVDDSGLLGHARAIGACSYRALQPLLLAHGRAPWNRVAMLLFEQQSTSPSAVIKSVRTRTFNEAVTWEHKVLRRLATMLSPALRRSIPRTVAFHWNGLAAVVESCVGGASIDSRIGDGKARTADDYRLAASWLAAFHLETTHDHVEAASWLSHEFHEGEIAEYARMFVTSPEEGRLFRLMSDSVDTCRGLRLPMVWQHSDFGPWNIYRAGREIRVIDWEGARMGPPLADLAYLSVHWTEGTTGHRTPAAHLEPLLFAMTRARFPEDGTATAVAGVIDRYARQVGVAPALYPYLIVWTFATQATSRMRRLRAVAPDQPMDGEARRYCEYVRVLARYADLLFTREARHAA